MTPEPALAAQGDSGRETNLQNDVPSISPSVVGLAAHELREHTQIDSVSHKLLVLRCLRVRTDG